ncbi:hypothetical protein [Streptomyces sp. NPDC059161]|uniref:hypothetical protein n=1 Tax=unclassified Streptomyces TaxID=2593676 RepID=UPI0036677A53
MQMSLTMRPLLLAGLALTMGAVTAGCAAEASGTPRAVATSAPEASPAIKGALPQRDVDTINLADQLLLRSCLKRHGFKYTLFGTGGTRPPHMAEAPYNQKVDQARVHGFGGTASAATLNGAEPPDANTRYVASLSTEQQARYETAVVGNAKDRIDQRLSNGSVWSIPRQGCQADAYAQIYGTLPVYLQYVTFSNEVLQSASEGAGTDPRYKAAQRAWVSCVHTKGYNAQAPTELMRQALVPYTKPGQDKATTRQREIAMAVAAAECNSSTGLVAIHDRAKQENIDRLVRLNTAGYAAFRRTGAAALARAETIVARDELAAGPGSGTGEPSARPGR